MEERGEHLYFNTFCSLTDGILLVDAALVIRRVNPAAEELFTTSRSKMEGQLLDYLLPRETNLFDKVKSCLATRAVYRDVECLGLRRPYLKAFPVSLTVSPLEGDDPILAVLQVRDLSWQKELQETTSQADQISSLSVLALGMAHEIKNPLVAISGSAQLLLRDLTSEHERKFLEVVVSESDRINRMVERMLDFARPRNPEFMPTNIHKVLEDIIVLQREALEEKKIRLTQEYDPSLPPIDANEDQLRQVFLNLIQNAIHATPANGEIRVVTRAKVGQLFKHARKGVSSGGLALAVEIIDSGPGIPEAQMKNLFTPFFSTKKKGSGLGLPISLKLVEDHEGTIRISSSAESGTVVQVLLPVQQTRGTVEL